MELEHPSITKTTRTGYPFSDRRETAGIDGLGNEVYTGDEILVLNDEFYLVEELFLETIEVLEQQGAVYEIAK